MTSTDMRNKTHEGHNIKRFREMLGIKQEALAFELGDDWNQKKISLLEGKETVEPDILELVAKALKVPAEAIKNFSEEAAVNIISNTFQDESVAYAQYYKCTFNPFEKWVETVDKNEKLYEALLQSEREKVEILEKLLSEKKGGK
ncbi:helix-turn-helix transcriptional regulator [Chitinophaga sp. 22321]|uniref:Helix-turn-helix transcriptional regulator n=1 Tax=Chitinophaga hostae TaxID=2831022 RepID=A0ABS5IW77_9BACT|nr:MULTISPECIES: helix-turn-helix transcriptional regulator [Chitinophaga]MBS0026487.1 helix-turn-helix transcriptional regulator [Chitinophaga hostae]NLU90625.1 helix-turn-helix transcriptional regulator [Chitinophaga sp. Ak27]